jgi:hypothetical protein
MKVALLPGGFKPPHLGHYNMAKYLADFADNVIVRIGSKEREGIGPRLALEIFNYYKASDPDPRAQKLTISLAQAASPVRDVYDFVEKIAPEGSELILGIGEKDAKDGRYNSIPKFAEPRNIKAKIELVPPQAGGISGTRMREIIKNNNKEEFFKFIPEFLPEEIKEEIWTKLLDTTMPTDIDEMMGGTMNQQEMNKHMANMKKLRKFFSKQGDQMTQIPTNLTKGLRRKLYEGRYDAETLIISRFIIDMFKDEFGKNYEDDFEEIGKLRRSDKKEDTAVSYDLELYFYPTDFDKLGPNPFIVNAGADDESMFIQINYQPDMFPKAYNDLIAEIKDSVRHELEHIGQFHFDKGVKGDLEKDEKDLPTFEYLTLDYEIPAHVMGIYKNAKTRKISFTQALQDFIDSKAEELSNDQEDKITQIYTDYARKHLPAAKLDEGDTYEKMAAKGKKAGNLKQGTVRKRLNIPKGEKIPLSLINKELARLRKMEKRSAKNQKYYKALTLAKTLKTTTHKENIDPEAQRKHKGKSAPYGSAYEPVKEGDPKVGTGKKPKGSGRRLYTDEDPTDTVKVKFSTRQDIVNTLSKKSFKAKSHARQSQIINLIHQRVRAALSRAKDPAVKKRLRSAFEYIKKRKEASKRKTQRLKKEGMYPPYKANQVQQTRYKASDTFTRDPKKSKKLGYLEEIGIDLSNYSGQILPGDVLRAPKGFPLGGKKLEKSKVVKVIKNSREGVNRYKLSVEDKDGKRYTVRNFEMDGEYKGKKLPKFGLIRKSKKNIDEMKLFSQEWWFDVIAEEILYEGGAAGHMAHPFDLPNVKTGKDLIKSFEQAADSLKKAPGSVKIDGVNASIRLINLDGKRIFAMDRGSKKALDLRGVTKADLEDRFGAGHGMIKAGGNVLDIFNDALPSIQEELRALGLIDDPNIMFNMEYVSGKSNVQDYGKNFLAIHGLLKVETKEVQGARKMLTKRVTSEKLYDKADLEELLKKLEPFAKKKGFEIYGSVPTRFTKEPDFKSALNTKYTIDTAEGDETKTLAQWLDRVNSIPKTDRLKMNIEETDSIKDVGALSKQVYFAVFGGENVDSLFSSEQEVNKAIQGATTYLATEKLGDAILDVLDSPMGSVNDHEGVVIRDDKISPRPFKVTGKFITGGVSSDFQKK